MNRTILYLAFLIIFSLPKAKTSWSMIHSSPHLVQLKVVSSGGFSREIEVFYCLLGLPNSQIPDIEFTYSNPMNFMDTPLPSIPLGVYWEQFQPIRGIHSGTLVISPFDEFGIPHEIVEVSIPITIPNSILKSKIDKESEHFLKHRMVNWEFAKNWVHPMDSKILGDIPIFTLNTLSSDVEYIIIGDSDFESEILPLVQHRNHFQDNPIQTIFVASDSIYWHYSENGVSAEAIKSFLHDAYTLSNSLTYCLLMGDVQFIPTLYDGNYASDDLFSTFNGNIPEIATGRFTAKTLAHVQNFVNKVIQYETEPELGLWRQRITLVADDEARPNPNDTSHTHHSEELAKMLPENYDIEKIYLMEYPESSDASIYGVSKPEATEALFNHLYQGTAVINYIGHGSYYKWAQEGILDNNRGDISSIQTGHKLPLWIAGTCSWGEFDHPEYDAFSEDIIRLDGNGAIAIISTSRGIGESSNWILLRSLYSALFEGGNISDIPLGIILQNVKTGSPAGKLFHLFGDPAMKLKMTKDSFEMILSEPINILSPEVVTAQSNFSSPGGNGLLIVKESDRIVERNYSYVSHSGLVHASISYFLPGSYLSIGELSFPGDQLVGNFWIPLDITGSNIDVKLYIQNSNGSMDATSILKNIDVDITNQNVDFSGPNISFFSHDNHSIEFGDHVSVTSKIRMQFTDPSGINITGELGHEIQLILDESQSPINLTNKFIYNLNDITTGNIYLDMNDFIFPIQGEIQCWDNANNVSHKEIYFTSLTENGLQLFNVFNYPNPMKNDTKFTFEISESANVSVRIFTLDGTLIKEIPEIHYESGYHHIYWDGTDAFGISLNTGVYIYQIKARHENKTVTKANRLAIFK